MPVCRLRVSPQRLTQSALVVRDGLEQRRLTDCLVPWHEHLVAPSLVVGQRFRRVPTAREPRVDSIDQQLHRAEGIGDALRLERIGVLPRVADERPTRPKWVAEEVWQVARAPEPLYPLPTTQSRCKRRHQIERGIELTLDVCADHIELRARAY